MTGLLDYLAAKGSTLPEESVRIEEWGRDVALRGMTARERDLFEEAQLRRANAKAANGAKKRGQVQADLDNFRGRMVAAHIVEDGKRTFANARGEEVLGNQPASVIDKLFAVAQRLSGFSQADVDDLVGESEATDDAGPSTDLPASSVEPSPSSSAPSESVN
jgi:hypothetical protein